MPRGMAGTDLDPAASLQHRGHGSAPVRGSVKGGAHPPRSGKPHLVLRSPASSTGGRCPGRQGRRQGRPGRGPSSASLDQFLSLPL